MKFFHTRTRVFAILIVPLLVWAMLPASTGASPGWLDFNDRGNADLPATCQQHNRRHAGADHGAYPGRAPFFGDPARHADGRSLFRERSRLSKLFGSQCGRALLGSERKRQPVFCSRRRRSGGQLFRVRRQHRLLDPAASGPGRTVLSLQHLEPQRHRHASGMLGDWQWPAPTVLSQGPGKRPVQHAE